MSIVKLISWDAESVCGNAVEILSSAEASFKNILLIAEDPKLFSRILQKELNQTSLSEFVWSDEFQNSKKLPFANSEFDAVISIDLIGQLQKNIRPVLFREMIRTAKREVLLIVPLGTDLQSMVEQSLAKQYQEVFGTTSPELSNHLLNGLPTPDEVFSWIGHGETADIFYAGDVLAYQKYTEDVLRNTQIQKGLLGKILTQLKPAAENKAENDLELETVPMRRHRRLYLTLKK